MIDAKDMEKKSAHLRRQFEAKLGVRASTLQQALRKAGRQLPRQLRRDGAFLAKAEGLAGHPKLARMIDADEVSRAYGAIDGHLRTIDAADARKGRILGVLGSIAFNLLMLMVALIIFLWWRGYV